MSKKKEEAFQLPYTLHYNKLNKVWFVKCEAGTFYILRRTTGYYAAGKHCRTLRDAVIAVLLHVKVIPVLPF